MISLELLFFYKMAQHLLYVRKRDVSKAEFFKLKISDAGFKAAQSVGCKNES